MRLGEMENQYYRKENHLEERLLKEKYLKDLNSHLPQWAKKLVELYISDFKYKININENCGSKE